ncbi:MULTISPECIES: cytidylyltransferase domain-containing protein [Kordiimonas]|jgi:N-acylneuraminate cytidylyltransferase|uniref:acylneuraminate cytidylyltransferase family protein n=1 Tax=Kordiimonas TaxID=288021 RepID=UPI00257C82FF|nr:acylneuraminate cytidylyltransferase family protein [Kordiimonas sp. UBA4487]
MSLTAFVFARGGSKGLPGKNIKPLAGIPLIGWAIQQALAVPEISRVVVSTDTPEIADIARDHGAEVPFIRPDELASDTASEWDAWRHALKFLKEQEGVLPDPFISVPATSPLRRPEDIASCIDLFAEGQSDIVVAVTEAHRNPWFNMVRSRADGTLVPVNARATNFDRRQDAPVVMDMTTIAYVANPRYILSERNVFDGRVRGVVVPVERSIDIDTNHDFEIADFLMKKRQGSL